MADSETESMFCGVWAALVWIAFRGVPPPDDEWWDASQPGQCPEIKAALRARIAGSPRLWRGPGREPETWRYRATMRRWMRGENSPASAKTAVALLADMEKCDRENAWGTAFWDKLQAQLPELNRAVSEGRLQAEGRPTTDPILKPGDKPRVPIPPSHVDEKRQIDATGAIRPSGGWGFLKHDLGPCYSDVQFKALDVMACWKREAFTPEPSIPRSESVSTSAVGPAGKATEAMILTVARKIISHAREMEMKPPNTKELGKAGRRVLFLCGKEVSENRFSEVADRAPDIRAGRLKRGVGAGSLRAFSVEQFDKSGCAISSD